jgi:hypothetical protein
MTHIQFVAYSRSDLPCPGATYRKRLFKDGLIKLYTCTTDEGQLLSRHVAVDFLFGPACCHRCVMATRAAGVPYSIQAAARFVSNRTPAQRSRLARDGELLHRSLPDGEDSRWKFVYRMAWPGLGFGVHHTGHQHDPCPVWRRVAEDSTSCQWGSMLGSRIRINASEWGLRQQRLDSSKTGHR